MYVCMYVCMYACMYVCMYVCIYIYIYIHIPTHKQLSIQAILTFLDFFQISVQRQAAEVQLRTHIYDIRTFTITITITITITTITTTILLHLFAIQRSPGAEEGDPPGWEGVLLVLQGESSASYTHKHIYIYIYMYVCMYVCMYIYIYIYTYAFPSGIIR